MLKTNRIFVYSDNSHFAEGLIEKLEQKYDVEVFHVLKEQIKEKLENPINKNNKKIIIFTAFAHTANYLYEQLKDFNLSLQLQTAKITGSDVNKSTLNINNEFKFIFPIWNSFL